ncbi:MAG: glutamate 5-kinase [Pseudomonadota bacterium]
MTKSPPHHGQPKTGVRSAADVLAASRRIVVKVGSALLVDRDGRLETDWLADLGADLRATGGRGAEIMVVSSGAIGLGRDLLGLKGRLKLEEKQAAAAAGQSRLIEAWRTALSPDGSPPVAQVLITLADAEDRRRYLNARATLFTLLQLGAVPVINENDTTATQEIRYGDNDRLAAHVAQMTGADCLLILSDIDGLYDQDPRTHKDAAHIPFVEQIDATIHNAASGPNEARGAGSGGMRTKIDAAQIAAGAGCWTIIAKGDQKSPISAVLSGGRATVFAAKGSPERARRAWIAGRLKPSGAIHVDAGAAAALRKGASLLPAGVIGVDGEFSKGDAVSVTDGAGVLIAQGLCAYDASEVASVIGLQLSEVERVLGYRRAAVIHRDDLALISETE